MPNTKNTIYKILIYTLPAVAILAMSVIVIPPMVHLDFLKEKIENVILTKTGISAKIDGDVNISLLGRATIVAHNLIVPNGVISSCEFEIPLFDIFDIKNANISDKIYISGASLDIDKIVPFDLGIPVQMKNSKMHFLNKEYNIISADLSPDKTHAIVRTDQHKYDINSENNYFVIKNVNNYLTLTGELFPDGTADAHISIIAQDINRWFEFEKPRITGQFPITSDMHWNGSYGVDFYDISANGIHGDAILYEDGYKNISLSSKDANYDLSFLATNSELFQSTTLDLDFYGKLKFFDKTFNHIKINTVGHNDKIEIKNIIADDLNIVGGTIDKNGAHNVNVTLPENGIKTTCLFNGNANDWSCEKFSYGNKINGTLKVTRNNFFADIKSNEKIPDIKDVIKSVHEFGNVGVVKFDFPDMSGTITINKNKYDIKYNHLDNKTLVDAKINLEFLPKFMQQESGNFVWDDTTMIFIPNSKTWRLMTKGDFFILHGDSFKPWFKNIDLQSLNDMPYVISGNYKKGNISNLTIEIAEHKFVGSVSKKSITLKTDLLNLDYFVNQDFKENYEELSFFTQSPIMIPFDIDANIALSAKSLIYNNQRYNNFVYSLRKDIQTFSISDSDRGNLLATITKDNIKYDINIQLNKFAFDEKLLPHNMPLNISDTNITAEIKLKTYGKIGHDIFDNLNGTFDASFVGGKLYGIGIDDFYAFAPNITTLNAESALYKSLTDGITKIKTMHIIGTYNSGEIRTTQPLTLAMKHVDASGVFEIANNEMLTKLSLLLRGTSASPEKIDLTIFPDNTRDFSLSEIMISFDPEYMRTFVQSHNQF